MDGWMTVTMVASVLALALDYLRERRLEERVQDAVTANTTAIHEQTRRIDAAFSAGRALAERVDSLDGQTPGSPHA